MNILITIYSTTGIFISFILNLTPIPSLIKANITRDISEISHAYLIMASANYLNWCLYATKVDLLGPLINNLIGLCFTIAYIIVYHKIKGDIWKFGPIYFSCCACISLIMFKVPPSDLLGLLSVGLSALQYMAPIEQIKPALLNKDPKYIDIFLIPALMSNAAVWGVYGFLVDDWFIIIPNLMGLLFSLFQILVYVWAQGFLPHPTFSWLANKIREKPIKMTEDDTIEFQNKD
ncbi:unnamed protein product [Blepharisma stoltei]|uniref:Sugar transporter SWEET n=1 Tax=Blepharisma stoltei TaxID=1481888 RepID=A0AAU9K687_9CILI|nr:unnamed protein product [Blepharisma stoltei]